MFFLLLDMMKIMNYSTKIVLTIRCRLSLICRLSGLAIPRESRTQKPEFLRALRVKANVHRTFCALAENYLKI